MVVLPPSTLSSLSVSTAAPRSWLGSWAEPGAKGGDEKDMRRKWKSSYNSDVEY